MATSDRFNLLIVDPDTASRGMLKQVALSLTTFNKTYNCNNLEEALDRGKTGEAVDIIILSYRFNIDDISNFIKEAKKTPKGEDWAFIAVQKNASKENSNIANSVVMGIDGFLFEPYSADNMREMAEITSKIKKVSSDRRKLAAMKMILNEIAQHLDAVSFYKSQGKDTAVASKKLKEACDKITKYKDEFFEMYIEVMTNVFGNMAPPATSSYIGASTRVKKKLEEQRLAKLSSEYK